MSTIKVNTIQNTSGVEVYTVKAWVNFNGIGTVAIRDDGNVSSITDYNTGNYGISFSSSFSSANYSAAGSANGRTYHPSRALGTNFSNAPTTTEYRIYTGLPGGNGIVGLWEDPEYTHVSVYH